MKKLFLIAGHSLNDPGAVSTLTEAELTRELRGLIAGKLIKFNPEMIIVQDSDKDSLGKVLTQIAGAIEPGDLLIDIHFNAFPNPKATGAEVLVKNGASERQLKTAAGLSSVIASTLGLVNRGAKTEKDAARQRIGILHGDGDRYLLEICFISNPEDLKQYQKFKFILADALSLEIEKLMK